MDTERFASIPLNSDAETTYHACNEFDRDTALEHGIVVVLTGVDAALSCEATVFPIPTCHFYAEKKSTVMRRD